MTAEVNLMLRRAIGLEDDEIITFESLNDVLLKIALKYPFENLRIINKKTEEITREYLVEKLLVNGEGGLCYELNPLLFYFLEENGFDVQMLRGTVFNHSTRQWPDVHNTHVGILLRHEGRDYLLDTGFGGNLPLKPVPLSGEIVTSINGSFRVCPIQHDLGNYIYEMKIRHKDEDWRTGYIFNTEQPVAGMKEMDEIQNVIVGNKDSHFNKGPLITRLTMTGNITLTEHSFTQWHNGEESKEEIDRQRYEELAEQYFEIKV